MAWTNSDTATRTAPGDERDGLGALRVMEKADRAEEHRAL